MFKVVDEVVEVEVEDPGSLKRVMCLMADYGGMSELLGFLPLSGGGTHKSSTAEIGA